ncbi:hypothetical protein [Bradyrhizobium sp. AC87j1]|uniref:hypothetical protein n=1 Tax=Bradyrhizobium sp. AC87j1 TaxID=2055894 RepID=UPI0011B08FB2|nr:hypothetical protein [Bradyrhizobium sp. AC87j1]
MKGSARAATLDSASLDPCQARQQFANADKLKFGGSSSLRAEVAIGKKWQNEDCQGYIEVE